MCGGRRPIHSCNAVLFLGNSDQIPICFRTLISVLSSDVFLTIEVEKIVDKIEISEL